MVGRAVKTSIYWLTIILLLTVQTSTSFGQPSDPITFSDITEDPPHVSVRNHFKVLKVEGWFTDGYRAIQRNGLKGQWFHLSQKNIPGIEENGDKFRDKHSFTTTTCPKDIIINIHGFNHTPQDAKEATKSTRISLLLNDYDPVQRWNGRNIINFTWPSEIGVNQEIDLDDRFDMAQNISEKVGLKLKAFIMNYKEACSNTNIRIIAHSLGAQVALWTVSKLNSDDSWRHRIQSLHLLGAAVSHDQTKSSIRLDEKTTGDAVEYEVQYAWNYYSTEDPILNYGYLFETFGQPAIGSTPGTQNPKILSCNATPIIGKAHRFYTTPYHGVVSYIVEDWESEGSKQECSF